MPLTVRRFSQQKRDCSHAFYRKTILVFSHIYNEEYTLKCCLLAHLLRPIFPFEEELRTRISGVYKTKTEDRKTKSSLILGLSNSRQL